MTPEEARKNLRDLELREFAYNHAAGMLYFDGVTAAPKGTYTVSYTHLCEAHEL